MRNVPVCYPIVPYAFQSNYGVAAGYLFVYKDESLLSRGTGDPSNKWLRALTSFLSVGIRSCLRSTHLCETRSIQLTKCA